MCIWTEGSGVYMYVSPYLTRVYIYVYENVDKAPACVCM